MQFASPPDVILFDLGGVLMDFSGLQRLAALTGEENGPELRKRWVASPWPQAFERGQCDAKAFGAGVVADWGLDMSASEFVAEFASWPAGPFAGSIDLIRDLDGKIRMGCLSNTNPSHWNQHLERWGIVDHFEWKFVSHELQMMKPDPAIYQHVIAAIGLHPAQLLFLDDVKENVLAARAAGMRSEHTQGIDDVKRAISQHAPSLQEWV